MSSRLRQSNANVGVQFELLHMHGRRDDVSGTDGRHVSTRGRGGAVKQRVQLSELFL